MKLLFEESFENNETLIDFKWIQTGYNNFNAIKIDELVSFVESFELTNKTFFYFYTEIVNGDAIKDKVRTMITVYYDLNKFDLNTNFSDSIQAMHWDEITSMKKYLIDLLNK